MRRDNWACEAMPKLYTKLHGAWQKNYFSNVLKIVWVIFFNEPCSASSIVLFGKQPALKAS